MIRERVVVTPSPAPRRWPRRPSPGGKGARTLASLPPLAREVEDEEDRTRGLLRPVRAAGEPLQHPEQAGRGLVPVAEGPAHGLPRQVVARAREGADRGLDVHRCPPSSPGGRGGGARRPRPGAGLPLSPCPAA